MLYTLMGLAYGMHSSLIITIAAFAVSGVYKNPKIYLYIWLVAIPLSWLAAVSGKGSSVGLVLGMIPRRRLPYKRQCK
ncbi:hypothetical protein LDL59_03650 [Kaistella anthropi]|nr:hypothetical protein [Kaistella anthropi]